MRVWLTEKRWLARLGTLVMTGQGVEVATAVVGGAGEGGGKRSADLLAATLCHC